MLLVPTRGNPEISPDVRAPEIFSRREFVKGMSAVAAGRYLDVFSLGKAQAQERAREKQPLLHPIVEEWLREAHPSITKEMIGKLEDDLDDDEFDVREKAEMELKKILVHPVPYLRRTGKSVEQSGRLGKIHELHDKFGCVMPPIKGDGLLVLEAISTVTQNGITFDSATEKEIKKKLATIQVEVKRGATFFSFLADVCEQAGIHYNHGPSSVEFSLGHGKESMRPAAEKGQLAIFMRMFDGIPVMKVYSEPRSMIPKEIDCAKLAPGTRPFKPEEGRIINIHSPEPVLRRGMLPITGHDVAAPLGVPYQLEMHLLRGTRRFSGYFERWETVTFSMPALPAKEELSKPMR